MQFFLPHLYEKFSLSLRPVSGNFFTLPQSIVGFAANHQSLCAGPPSCTITPDGAPFASAILILTVFSRCTMSSAPSWDTSKETSCPSCQTSPSTSKLWKPASSAKPWKPCAVVSPFLLRTANPPLADASGKKVLLIRRLGKRICIGLEDDLWLVLHLMIAGRLHWHPLGSKARPRKSFPASWSSRIRFFQRLSSLDRSRFPKARLSCT